MNKLQIIKERFDLQATEGGTTKAQFELDKNAKFLIGIAITSDLDAKLYFRGSQKIQINDKELFPENYESKLLLSGLNVAPDERMVDLGVVPTGNGKLDVWFTDTKHAEVPFAPYRVSVYTYSVLTAPSK